MKLTKQTALELSLQHWQLIAENPDNFSNIFDCPKDKYYEKLCKEHGLTKEFAACFCCDVAPTCAECPVEEWAQLAQSTDRNCPCLRTEFEIWLETQNPNPMLNLLERNLAAIKNTTKENTE